MSLQCAYRTFVPELTDDARLDTGSGKTLIACLLIRHVLDQERVDRAEGKRQRIVFFIANRYVRSRVVGHH